LTVQRVASYTITTPEGRRIRTATKVVFTDGTERRFLDKMTKREALAQVVDLTN
jgi:hypothetical protein